jgi:hypothetical protein
MKQVGKGLDALEVGIVVHFEFEIKVVVKKTKGKSQVVMIAQKY